MSQFSQPLLFLLVFQIESRHSMHLFAGNCHQIIATPFWPSFLFNTHDENDNVFCKYFPSQFRNNQQLTFPKQTLYKFIMIKVTNLTLIVSLPNTQSSVNKQLKLTSGVKTIQTKGIGKILSEGQVKWDDTIVLPFSNKISFEIITKHQFGYNPQELDGVMNGQISVLPKNIQKELKTITNNVFNIQGEKIGFLKADLRFSNKIGAVSNNSLINNSQINTSAINQSQILAQPHKVPPPQTPKQEQPQTNHEQIMRISSIVAHVNEIKGKKIYLVIKCGAKSIKTQEFMSKAGEFVYIGQYDLKREKIESQIQIDLNVIEEAGSQLLAQSVFLIDSEGKIGKKGELRNTSGKQIGQLFIDCKIHIKDAKNKHYLSLLSRYADQPFNRPQSDIDSLKNSSVSRKKMSIVNSNQQINFSKQKRFFGTEDKKSDYITYQTGWGSTLDFKQKRTSKFYRGASIGRGSKVDFIAQIKANPGVGQYRLPSIWDRY